jgi:hypothetical protein
MQPHDEAMKLYEALYDFDSEVPARDKRLAK